MLKKRILKKELIDDLKLSNPLVIENLKDMEFLNQWLGYNKILIGAINTIIKKNKPFWQGKKISIADLGCGSGDGLRCIGDWLKKKGYQSDLSGIDGNEAIIAYAKEKSINYLNIKYYVKDILLEETYAGFNCDIFVLSNICHHFNECEIKNLLKILKNSNCKFVIINDLHRCLWAYLGIRVLSTICHFSTLTKHDGPLSVRKGFRKKDLTNILESAENSTYKIRWKWPFRWQVIIWIED